MEPLFLDIESRSRCDLKARGVYNYAADSSTKILVLSYALGHTAKVKRWEPWRGKAMPAELVNMLADRKLKIVAHNAAFERIVMSSLKLMPNDIERWICTATQARACAMPAALEDLPMALGIKSRKDREGAALMRLLSIPDKDGNFSDDAEALTRYGLYCDRDTSVMRDAYLTMPPLTDEALEVYFASETINDRGVPIDTELCGYAMEYAERERVEANANVVAITNGACKTGKGAKLTEWIYERVSGEAQKLMEITKKRRVNSRDRAAPGYDGREYTSYDTKTLNAETRDALLDLAESNPDLFMDGAVEAIEAADAAAASSIAKFKRMKDMTCSDGRLRGAFVMNGASGTGRFSSKGAQVHNFPRKCAKDPEAVRELMAKGADLGGPVLTVLKSMLRAAICAPNGKTIVRSDFNAIEARGLPWLAAREGAERYLDAFRDKTRDIYVEQASASGLDSRQAGKVVVLALGFGGAEGALTVMCAGYGVQIDNKSRVVANWRRANSWAPMFWRDLSAGFSRAKSRPDMWHDAGRVSFYGSDGNIIMHLPSGRHIVYPSVALDEEGNNYKYLKAAWKPAADATEWPKAKIWHGLICENADQATCADLLRSVLVRGIRQGLPIIGHVHDEVICETAKGKSKSLAKALEKLMLDAPEWAEGFPLAVETDVNQRFRK